MRNLIDKLGGRKFILALIIFITGTALALFDRLSYEWVAVASTVLGIYGFANAATHRGYARAQAPWQDDEHRPR